MKKKAPAKRPKVRPKLNKRSTQSKIDEKLLRLPHSGLSKLSSSLKKIGDFTSDFADKNGIAGFVGRAVLLRAKSIRAGLSKKAAPKVTEKISARKKK